MKIRYGLLAATILTVPVVAKAEAINGLYVGAGVGANFMQDTNLKSVKLGGVDVNLGKTKESFDTGYRPVVSVGYGFGNGLRAEVEGTYYHNAISRVGRFASGGIGASFVPSSTTVDGNRAKYGGFLNVLYDFDPNVLGLSSYIPFPVTPYIGAGAGYLQSQNENVRYQNGRQLFVRSTGTDGNFAYQAIIGAAFPLAAVPGLAVTAEYRFSGIANDLTYKAQYFTPGSVRRAFINEDDGYNHSLMLGLRYAFNAAPPPVAAMAPAPVQQTAARSYLVFFDWDRADLTDRARQIIAEAAQATTRVQVTRIEVSGNTDTTGTAQYNQALSVRRAQNVAAELVRLGVPRDSITARGYGFTRLLVATGPGVREPQNRRVDIVLR